MHAMIPTHTQTIRVVSHIYSLYNIKCTENAPFIPTYARYEHTPAVRLCVCVNGFWVLALYKEVYEFNIYILVRWPAWLNSLFKLLFTHNVESIVRWQKILAQNTRMHVCTVYVVLLLLLCFHSQLLTPSTHFAAKSACYEASSVRFFCSFS